MLKIIDTVRFLSLSLSLSLPLIVIRFSNDHMQRPYTRRFIRRQAVKQQQQDTIDSCY
jgi:hypothetical protein